MDIYVGEMNNKYIRFYFLSYYIIAVVIVLNIFVAFILEYTTL